jgi:hypothetical protein
MTRDKFGKRLAAVLCAAGAVVAGCATGGGGGMYSQPYALFEPETRSAPDDRAPAPIMSIDGKNRAVTDNTPVEPGMRTVVVSIPGPRGMSDPGRTTLEVDAKPCTRYYFAAKRSSRTDDDWKGYVSGTDPIGECARKFQGAK